MTITWPDLRAGGDCGLGKTCRLIALLSAVLKCGASQVGKNMTEFDLPHAGKLSMDNLGIDQDDEGAREISKPRPVTRNSGRYLRHENQAGGVLLDERHLLLDAEQPDEEGILKVVTFEQQPAKAIVKPASMAERTALGSTERSAKENGTASASKTNASVTEPVRSLPNAASIIMDAHDLVENGTTKESNNFNGGSKHTQAVPTATLLEQGSRAEDSSGKDHAIGLNSFEHNKSLAEVAGRSAYKEGHTTMFATRINPMSSFYFEPGTIWRDWPGLSKQIHLWSDCVIIAQYQTSTEAIDVHMFSRLVIDGQVQEASRSAMGNTLYAVNFGLFAGPLAAGSHQIAVQYKTAGGAGQNRFDGLSDWQTRALNIIALPEAEANTVNPRWGFKLNSANLWSDWQGLEQEILFDVDTPVFVVYAIACYGKNTFLASKLFLDGHEKKATRSVSGEIEYALNTGFFVDTVPAGSHLWTVKYRTSGRDNFFLEDSTGNDWMNRALYTVQLHGATVHKVYDDSEYVTISTQRWTTWKGLTKDIELPQDRYVIVTYSLAVPAHSPTIQVSTIKSRLDINEEEQTQTRSRCGNVRYCQLLGMWMGMLQVGPHNFKVKYATASAIPIEPGGGDWGNRALNIIVLSQLSTAVASFLQESAEVHHEGDQASFIDLGSHLKRVEDLEDQVKKGTAPEELMKKVNALEALES